MRSESGEEVMELALESIGGEFLEGGRVASPRAPSVRSFSRKYTKNTDALSIPAPAEQPLRERLHNEVVQQVKRRLPAVDGQKALP